MCDFKAIEEFAKVRRGASPRPINAPKWFGGNVGWVRIIDVTRSKRYLRSTEQYLSPLGESKSVRVDKGDLIMSICATIGRPVIVDMPACIHDGFVQLYDIQGADTVYLYYALQNAEQEFINFGQTGTQANLNTSIVSKYSLFFPPFPEQRKIARILTTVDNLIEKTEALIAKYQSVKRGMMHDLFTRGVDEHGHLRPPYEEAPHLYKNTELGWIPKVWCCCTLGAFITRGPQNGLYKPASAYSVDGSPIVRIDGFYDGELRASQSFQRLRLTQDELRLYTLEEDDLLINRVNSIDYVGKSAIVPCLDEATVFESNIMRLQLDQTRLLAQFAIRLLCLGIVQRQFWRCAKSAIAQASINQQDVQGCLIPVPSIYEQRQISERYISINTFISHNAHSLGKLKQTKTGLMQDLLTGKVRVAGVDFADFD